MSSFLKTTKQHKAGVGLKYLLHEQLSIMDPPRSLKILHASELTHEDTQFCPRERAYLLRDGDTRKPQHIGTSLNITFQTGRWIENQLRDVWLRQYVLGDWKCAQCGHTHKVQTAPDTCEQCGVDGTLCHYIEPRAYSEVYDTSCGLDFLLWRNEKLQVVEVKSIDKDYFRDLKAPMSEHRHRTQFYLDLLSQSTWMDYDVDLNLDTAILLYVCKGFGFADNFEGRKGVSDAKFSPFKEYTIKRGNPKDMNHIYNRALAVKEFKETGHIPSRICPTITCTRAKKCSCKKTCFTE